MEEWLDIFERVSRYNSWCDTTKLNNVLFYLTGVAKTWLRNPESDLPRWEVFQEKFKELSGRAACRTAEVIEKLSYRVQQPEESYTGYIEDIVSLCKRADPVISNSGQVRHIMKGVREDAFLIFGVNSPKTVDDVTTVCKALEEARRSRIRLPFTPTASESLPLWNDLPLDALRTIIRDVVREELERRDHLRTSGPYSGHDINLKAVICQEIAAAIPQTRAAPTQPLILDVGRDALPTQWVITRSRLLPQPRLWHPYKTLTSRTNQLLLRLLVSIAVSGGIFQDFVIGDNAISVFMVNVICLQTSPGTATYLITLGHVTATGPGTATNPILVSMVITMPAAQSLHDADLRIHIHADPKLPAALPDSDPSLVRKTGSRDSRGPYCEYGIDKRTSTATQEHNHDIFGPFTSTGIDRHWLVHFCSFFSSVQTAP